MDKMGDELSERGSLSIRLDEENSPYFRPSKGLRQRDPLSPLLFNFIVDVFSRILVKVVTNDHITGLMGTLYPEGIISLQYADNTLLFLEHNYTTACHLKWLLVCFEKLSGTKINYHKNDLTPTNLHEEESQSYLRIFCCKLGEFPFKYLGVPLHYDKLRKEDIQSLVDKIIKWIAGWKGRLLSYGVRLALLRACLASIPIYLMFVIKFPKWAIEVINSHMTIFWGMILGTNIGITYQTGIHWPRGRNLEGWGFLILGISIFASLPHGFRGTTVGRVKCGRR
jgi:hypothetical protein